MCQRRSATAGQASMPGEKKYLQGGMVALRNDKNIKPGALTEGILDPPNAEMQQLLARMDGMQMEIDILKETINVLKKDPGINTESGTQDHGRRRACSSG